MTRNKVTSNFIPTPPHHIVIKNSRCPCDWLRYLPSGAFFIDKTWKLKNIEAIDAIFRMALDWRECERSWKTLRGFERHSRTPIDSVIEPICFNIYLSQSRRPKLKTLWDLESESDWSLFTLLLSHFPGNISKSKCFFVVNFKFMSFMAQMRTHVFLVLFPLLSDIGELWCGLMWFGHIMKFGVKIHPAK